MNPTEITETFKTKGADRFQFILENLNAPALTAWTTWLSENREVQEAAAALRPDNFSAFLENNCSRFLTEFERATR